MPFNHNYKLVHAGEGIVAILIPVLNPSREGWVVWPIPQEPHYSGFSLHHIMELLGKPVRPWCQPLGIGVLKLCFDSLGVVILELLDEPFAVCNDDTPEVVLRRSHFFNCGFRRPACLQKSFAVCLAAVNWWVGFGAAACSAGVGAAACPVLVLWIRGGRARHRLGKNTRENGLSRETGKVIAATMRSCTLL